MRIYIVYLLNTLSTSSNTANRIFLALFAVKLGASPLMVGMLGAMFSVVPSLLAVKIGRLHDRFGSRQLFLIATVVGGLSMLLPWWWPSISIILIAALLCGFSAVFFNVCTQNLTGLLSTPDTRTRYFSNYSLSNSMAFFLGPLIAGFSIEYLSSAHTCLVLAGFAAVPFLVLAWRRKPLEPSHAASRQRGKSGEKSEGKSAGRKVGATVGSDGDGAWALLRNPAVRTTLYTGSLLNAVFGLNQIYMPVFLDSLGIAASTIGIIVSMYATAAFVVRLVLPGIIHRWTEARVLMACFFMSAASLALMPFFPSVWVLALLSFVMGLGMGMGVPIANMQMYANSPQGRSGEALGLKMTTNNFTKIISPLVFGAVASAFGLGPLFWLNALMLATGGVLSRPREAAPRVP